MKRRFFLLALLPAARAEPQQAAGSRANRKKRRFMG